MTSTPIERPMSGPDKVNIIAEVGSVHDGSFGNALQLIETAAGCGVDAVKFQTHMALAETLPDAPMPPYFQGEPRFEYFERTGFDPGQWTELKAHCEGQGVEFMSSVFSIEAVEVLEDIGVARHKVPSGEVTNLPLLATLAQTGKPILLSSGMSSWEELDLAVETIREQNEKITVMQCTSEYPCPYDRVGLNVMLEMKERYKLPVGLSDHTMTNYAAFTAATLGVSVVEIHFTLSRKMYGSDAKHSIEPHELSDLVSGIRAIEIMLGSDIDKSDINHFAEMKKIFEKSIVSLVEIPEGTIIEEGMLGVKKPGTGLPPNRINDVLGRRTTHKITKDALISEEDLAD